MSSRPSRTATAARRAPGEGWTPVDYNRSEAVQRRRAAAARVRRRRLFVIDLGIGLAIALAAIVIAPGLAIVAIVALVGLAAVAGSVVLERRRGRR